MIILTLAALVVIRNLHLVSEQFSPHVTYLVLM